MLQVSCHAGVMRPQVTAFRGSRSSTVKAFLRPVIDRPNLQVATNAHVNKVGFDKQYFRTEHSTPDVKTNPSTLLFGIFSGHFQGKQSGWSSVHTEWDKASSSSTQGNHPLRWYNWQSTNSHVIGNWTKKTSPRLECEWTSDFSVSGEASGNV